MSMKRLISKFISWIPRRSEPQFTFMHGHTFGEHKMHESTYREGIVRSNGDDFPHRITSSSGTEGFVAHFPVGGDMKQAYDALLES